MELEQPIYRKDQAGYPYVSLEVDGQKARIYYEQKAIEYGLVFLGAAFEEVLPPVELPADPANGRPEAQQLFGFTDDERVLAICTSFRAAVDAGEIDGLVEVEDED